MSEKKSIVLGALGKTIYELDESDLGKFNYLTTPQGNDLKDCFLVGAKNCPNFLQRVDGYRVIESPGGYPVCMEFYELKKLPEILSR